jgi:hypothetical protein
LYKILNKEIRPMDFLDAILNLGKVNAWKNNWNI